MTDSNGVYNAGEAAIWLQYAPNRQPLFLGVHHVDKITRDFGKKELIWTVDPSGPSKFQVVGSYRGAPQPATTAIETLEVSTADYLERMGTTRKFALIFNRFKAGRRNDFTNYDRSQILTGVEITKRDEAGVAARDPGKNGAAMITMDLSADDWLFSYPLNALRQATTETQAITCVSALPIAFLDDAVYLAAGCKAGTGVKAHVLTSSNSGGTWTSTAAQPFANDEDINAIRYFPLTSTINRILVVRKGITAQPLKIAYSDDGGATWTTASVGSTNAQGVTGARNLFVLDAYHIWLVADSGYVYFSADGGATWTTQDAGIATAQNLNAVYFIDSKNGFAVGAADAVIKTVDGGNSWSAGTATGTGDTLNVVTMIDSKKIWVGITKSSGSYLLMYSEDSGATWTGRTISGVSTGNVKAIRFVNPQVGYLLYNTTGPVGKLYKCRDGGYTWELISTPTNSGLEALIAIDDNQIFSVGLANGGTGVIIHAQNGAPS